MKTFFIQLVVLIAFSAVANAQPSSAAVAKTDNPKRNESSYKITERGANHRVVHHITSQTSQSGLSVTRTNTYTELASGLHYRNAQEQWEESREEIELLPQGGAAATKGQHRAYFPADIYSGFIELVTPDGKRLKSRPLCVSYFDGTNNVLLGELTNSVGQILFSGNQVIYPNCFTGFKADLRYTYRKSGFEQDLILREQPPSPKAFGLDPERTRLEVLTEFFDAVDPVATKVHADPEVALGLTDVTLTFGKLKMVRGKAFSLDESATARVTGLAVYKSWERLAGRTFLVEAVPVPGVAAKLKKLPLTTSPAASLAKLPARSALVTRRLPLARAAHPVANRKMEMAKVDVNDPNGLVVDYNTIVDSLPGDFTFQGNTTYYINGFLFSSGGEGVITIQGGSVLKFERGAALDLFNPVVCDTTAENPAYLTAVDDDTVGEPITGYSTGTPSGTYADAALAIETGFLSAPLQHLRIAYANYGVAANADIRHCEFRHTTTAVASFWSAMKLENLLLFDVATGFADFGSGAALDAAFVTAHQVGTLTTAPNLNIVNSLFINVASWGSAVPGPYNDSNPSDGGVFQSVGLATHYLTEGSAYRNQGTTTGIDSGLLADIQTRTTYAPQHGSHLDTDTPDLGYHYPVANPDSDNDGLDDAWEQLHFGNLNQTANEDYDEDSLTNLEEFLGGTNPTVSNRVATPAIAPAGGTFATQRSVTVTCPTPGALIHYTFNGNDPTENDPSIVSGQSVTVAHAGVLKVKAFKSGMLPSPVQSASFTITGAIAAGRKHTLGLKVDGKVLAAGSNGNGQCGDGTTDLRTTLGIVPGLPPVVGIAAGQLFSLAWTANGEAWAWGGNEDGQLGNGQMSHHQTTPIQVPITSVIAMAGGNRHTLALKSDGSVWAWGLNYNYQLGDGTDTRRLSPVRVKKTYSQFLSDIVAISAGGTHSLAVSSDGKVWAWGHGTSGQLGYGPEFSQPYPVRVKKYNNGTDLTDVKAVVAGLYHSLALTTDGKVWAWGLNDQGQLGLGDLSTRIRAVQISALSDVVAIAIGAGGHYSMALKSDGTVWTWGQNNSGQLGDCTSVPRRTTPGPTSNLSDIVAIAGCRGHGVALTDDGNIATWGWLNYGEEVSFSSCPITPEPDVTLLPCLITPIVSVQAIDPTAAEEYEIGKIRITRTSENLGIPLRINFQISGSATLGTDCLPLGTQVTIPSGQSSVDVVVRPRADCLKEAAETVILTLSAGADIFNCSDNYAIGTPNSATVTILDGPCNVCATPIFADWQFTDEGFILGDQEGELREYTDIASISASPWSIQSPDQLSLRLTFEDDNNCDHPAPNNPHIQTATAETLIVSDCPQRLFVSWSGVGEQQASGYELMSLYVDDVLVGSAHAPGGGLGCAPMAPVVSDPAPPQFIDLDPGVNRIKIMATTADALYHVGAYYQFELSLLPPPPGVPPTIVTQPQDQNVNGGGSVSFTVVASGTAPLQYQWRFGGVDIEGATGSTLTLNNIQPVQAGSYSVVVANVVGVAMSTEAILTVNPVVSITTQPQSQDVNLGGNVTFTVVAGPLPLQYQWRFNGVDINGANSSSLTLNSVTLAKAGAYSVRVFNAVSSIDSSIAQLTVHELTPPVIVAPPQERFAIVGSDVKFTVSASGAMPLTYRWFRNGTQIASGANPFLFLQNVQTANAGNYSVTVENSYNPPASSSAVPLTVVAVPLPPVVMSPDTSAILPATVKLSVPGYPDATIYYTLDGSTPTTSSSVYNPAYPLNITTIKTVTAFATKANYVNSGFAAVIIGDVMVPVARADVFSVDQDTSAVQLDVVGNDLNPTPHALTVFSVVQPENGTVAFTSGTADLTYEPSPSFCGIDAFTYTIQDTAGNKSAAAVTVFVNKSQNSSPLATDISVVLPAGIHVATINLVANNSDPDVNDVIVPYTIAQPRLGTYVRNGNQIVYTRTSSKFGSDEFRYTITDGKGGYAAATIRIDQTDSDGDALPDDWELTYLTTLNYGQWDDPDVDGVPNFAELMLHTDPNLSDNPLIIPLASGATISGEQVFTLALSPEIDSLESFQLLANGAFAPRAEIQKSADGAWRLILDTLTMPNGSYPLRLQYSYPDSIGLSLDPIRQRVLGPIKTVTINNAVTFDELPTAFTSALYVRANVNIPATSYTVRLFNIDAPTVEIKTLTGNLINNRIEDFWDLMDANQNVIVPDDLLAEITLTPPSGGGQSVQSASSPAPVPYKYRKEPATLNDHTFVVANGFDFTGQTATDVTKRQNAIIKNVVNLLCSPWFDFPYILLPGNANTYDGATFHMLTAADVTTVKTALRVTDNFIFIGHGSYNSVSSGTGPSLVSYEVRDLRGYGPSKKPRRPLRLAILDGCNTYSPAWSRAFGVPFIEESLSSDYEAIGLAPRAFVGFDNFEYSPGNGAWGSTVNSFFRAHGEMLDQWMGGYTIKECMQTYGFSMYFFAASYSYPSVGGRAFDWHIAGCKDLRKQNPD